MSRRPATIGCLPRGFPRVSGDEPATHDLIDAHKTFSPRERG